MAYTKETTVGDLLKDPKVAQLLETYIPGATTNPQFAFIKGFSLNMLLAVPQAKQMGLTEEMVDKFLVQANALGK